MQKDAWRKLNVRTIVLVGGGDFGRSPLATRMPAALWPLMDRPVLLRVLDHLAREGIKDVTVCCGREVQELVKSVCAASALHATLVVEDVISGTAGCVRDAAASDPGDLLLVVSGSMVVPPALGELATAHLNQGAELTMVFNPAHDGRTPLGLPAEIYLCQPQVLRWIPGGGYSDLKEGLIPALLRGGGRVHPLTLDHDVGEFRDRRGYLEALDLLLQRGVWHEQDAAVREEGEGGPILKGSDVFVHPTARIYGPVVVGDHVQIQEGAIVVGPTAIAPHTVVGMDSVVIRSAVWKSAALGARCEIRDSIIGERVIVPAQAAVVEQIKCVEEEGRQKRRLMGRHLRAALGRADGRVQSCCDFLASQLPGPQAVSGTQLQVLAAGFLLGVAFLWSYWPTFVDLMRVWLRSDEYSSGLLVPPLAAYVIWSRRDALAAVRLRPALLWGGAAFVLAQVIRAEGLHRMYMSAERLSLVLSLAALVLLLLGWQHLKKLTSVLLFLCLMLPWPNRVQTAVTLPLQSWSTSSAVFCLELTGYDVQRDGNVIHIGNASVAVAEACNGLRMVTAFFVISGLVVLLARRAWWEKLVVLISSLPIALLCNTLRLAATAVLFTLVEGEVWESRFHDWGGYAMMPLALALVVGELWLLGQLTTPPMKTEPAVVYRRQA